LTNYKITNTPFKRDVVAELARACHQGGIKLGFYYSPPDWYHPDYRTENHNRYVTFLHGQLRELCTKYGKVDILWFDGLGGTAKDWNTEELIATIRRLQPGILINNRAGVPADFDTPEQRVGRFQRDRAWESCITICRQWAWKPKDQLKSLKACITLLVKCVGGDGNLLLNVGPMPTGEIEARQVERLKEIGVWLSRYGESIYGTRGGPFKPRNWGASTCKANRIFVHILTWDGEAGPLVLPSIPRRILRASLLTGGEVAVNQSQDAIEISVPPASRQELDTIVVLELDGTASDIEPVSLATGALTFGARSTASNVYRNMSAYGPEKAVDDDDATRWATDQGTTRAWLEVDLGREATFDRAVIREEFDRIRKFELQYKEGDRWVAFHRGTRIGSHRDITVPRVTTRFVRLAILEAIEGPTIGEFQLFSPRTP
jgi:alpha-L-fucosidase